VTTDTAAAALPRSKARPDSNPSPAQLATYGLPMFGVGAFMGLLSVYFLKFATDVLLIAPATIGLLFGAARLWDAVSDPLAGHWSDRTRTRFGRRRPWIAGAAIPLALAAFALWSPPVRLGDAALVVWTTVALFAFYTAATAFTIPHLALGAELTPDPHARTRVYGVREMADKLGLFAAMGALYLFESSGDPRGLAPAIAAALSLGVVVALPLSVFRVRESAPRASTAPSPFSRAYRDVVRNPHARLLLVIFFLEQLGFGAVGSLLPYASEYVFHTPGWTAAYLLAFTLPVLVTIPLWIRLSRRFGKRRVWWVSLGVKAAGFTVLLFAPTDALPIVFASIAVIGVGHACGSFVPVSILADLVDWDELETGERKEGVYFAAWNLVVKAPIGVVIMLNGIVLGAVGFTPNVEQSEAVIWTLRALAAGLPCLWLLAGMALLSRFRFDEAAHHEVKLQLAARG
jgi:GPH family glycoside/pentoside/hexuronide:cation symporter